jgi:hypothetical protein
MGSVTHRMCRQALAEKCAVMLHNARRVTQKRSPTLHHTPVEERLT